jgi:hypothetical protein
MAQLRVRSSSWLGHHSSNLLTARPALRTRQRQKTLVKRNSGLVASCVLAAGCIHTLEPGAVAGAPDWGARVKLLLLQRLTLIHRRELLRVPSAMLPIVLVAEQRQHAVGNNHPVAAAVLERPVVLRAADVQQQTQCHCLLLVCCGNS